MAISLKPVLRLFVLTIFGWSLLLATPAWATTLNEAVQQVQQQTGGRVLSAETVNRGGRRVHRIKVLTPSGQVRVVTVDAGRR